MTKIISFKNEDGTEVVIEVNELDEDGTGRASRGEAAQCLAQKVFEKGLANLKPLAESVMNTAKSLNNPDEILVEFGIKVNAETGVIIASAGAEANFKVALKWKKT